MGAVQEPHTCQMAAYRGWGRGLQRAPPSGLSTGGRLLQPSGSLQAWDRARGGQGSRAPTLQKAPGGSWNILPALAPPRVG